MDTVIALIMLLVVLSLPVILTVAIMKKYKNYKANQKPYYVRAKKTLHKAKEDLQSEAEETLSKIVSTTVAIAEVVKETKQEQFIISPYKKITHLLTKSERAFNNILKEVINGMQVEVHSKVRMWDLLYVPKDEKEKTKFENKIKSKHVDFVLVNSNTSEILLIIELDDRSHNKYSRKVVDQFKNEALENAGHKILRVKTSYNYNTDELRNNITKLVS